MAMKPSPSTLCPTPSAASAAVPKRDVYRVSHMYTTESRTPASESGAPTRNTVGRARQSGASSRIRPRRQAMPIPMRNPPPRTITEARAAGRDGDQRHFHHRPERQRHPHVEPGGRHGGERGGPDQAADPDGIDEVEAEVARHHRDRRRRQLQDDGPKRPDGERAGRAGRADHGAGSYRGAGPGVNERVL